MKYEIDLFGVMVPSLLLWAVLAYILTAVVRRTFVRSGLYRHVWHRSLFDFSIYVCFLGSIVYVSKEYLS